MIKEYAAYLEQTHRLQDRFIPHYLRWVKSAYAYTKTSLSKPLAEEAKNGYLGHCANQHQEWQVKQADDSLRLYAYFLSISGDTPLFTKPALDDWAEFGRELKRVLRLRQRSPRTEKTYLYDESMNGASFCMGHLGVLADDGLHDAPDAQGALGIDAGVFRVGRVEASCPSTR